MTAGRGIVHAEMPGTDRMEGLQLWINLKSEDKLCPPQYQEKVNSEIIKTSKEGVEVTIIAGECLGVRSETVTRTPTYYLDIRMQAGSNLQQNAPNGWNSFLYVLQGKINVGNTEIKVNQTAIFDVNGDIINFTANEACRFVFLAGRPTGERIVHYGPFVMNTDKEIRDAIRDYSNGTGGFEAAREWKSRIGNIH